MKTPSKKTKHTLRIAFSYFILLFGYGWIVFSTTLGSDQIGHAGMFQRSGSILVVFALMIEFYLNKDMIQNLMIRGTNLYSAMAGTMIWGYGDILYSNQIFTVMGIVYGGFMIVYFVISKYFGLYKYAQKVMAK